MAQFIVNVVPSSVSVFNQSELCKLSSKTIRSQRFCAVSLVYSHFPSEVFFIRYIMYFIHVNIARNYYLTIFGDYIKGIVVFSYENILCNDREESNNVLKRR